MPYIAGFYTKILACLLQRVFKLSPQQKAFGEVERCLEHNMHKNSAVPSLAFANELVLGSESLPISRALSETETFMRLRGLRINSLKSYIFGLQKFDTRKLFLILTEPFLKISDSELPNESAGCLGLELELGGARKVMKHGFWELLARVVGSDMKPRQKPECFRVITSPQ